MLPMADTERSFSLDEANALLPTLIPLLESLRMGWRTARDPGRAATVRRHAGSNGGGTAGSELLRAAASGHGHLQAVTDLGVVVRDPERGLIDFPGHREDRPIFWCWQLGEPAVAWWHARDRGFSDRQPI